MKAWKWINTGAFAAMAAVNILANMLPIGGNTTAQVSAAYPSLFTPAPITFSVWGLIYLLMGLFVLYQWGLFDQGVYSTGVQADIGPWFAVSCALNIAWIFLWNYRQTGLSVICIALLLAALFVIRRRLKGAGGEVFQVMAAKSGFALYFGWIIAAFIANVGAWLTKTGWSGWGFSADFWTIAALLIGVVIATAVVLIEEDRIAALAVMWAYAGILIRHISPAFYAGTHPYVIVTAIFGEALILVAVLKPVIEMICGKKGGACAH